MIIIRPTTAHHPCSGSEFYHPACKKVAFKACRKEDEDTKTKSEASTTHQSNTNNEESSSSSSSRVFVERAPIHFQETEKAATIALDVAGFALEDIQVRMEDFVVSIDAKRVNKLGDTYVIRRRFRVDKSNVLEDEVRASLTDGILEVVVPKKAKVGPRSIPISTTRSVTAVDETEEKTEETDNADKDASTPSPASVEVETVKDDEDEDAAEKNAQVKQAQHEEESWEEVKD